MGTNNITPRRRLANHDRRRTSIGSVTLARQAGAAAATRAIVPIDATAIALVAAAAPAWRASVTDPMIVLRRS